MRISLPLGTSIVAGGVLLEKSIQRVCQQALQQRNERDFFSSQGSCDLARRKQQIGQLIGRQTVARDVRASPGAKCKSPQPNAGRFIGRENFDRFWPQRLAENAGGLLGIDSGVAVFSQKQIAIVDSGEADDPLAILVENHAAFPADGIGEQFFKPLDPISLAMRTIASRRRRAVDPEGVQGEGRTRLGCTADSAAEPHSAAADHHGGVGSLPRRRATRSGYANSGSLSSSSSSGIAG